MQPQETMQKKHFQKCCFIFALNNTLFVRHRKQERLKNSGTSVRGKTLRQPRISHCITRTRTQSKGQKGVEYTENNRERINPRGRNKCSPRNRLRSLFFEAEPKARETGETYGHISTVLIGFPLSEIGRHASQPSSYPLEPLFAPVLFIRQGLFALCLLGEQKRHDYHYYRASPSAAKRL